MKYALRLAYAGTQYCGWQRQREASGELPSIQGTLQEALTRIAGEEVTVVGSGRTDSGVHALGQVAHFVLKRKTWDPKVLLNGLNSLLPPEIRVLSAWVASTGFHAQRSALKKQYGYYFQQGSCALPHLAPFSWWIRKKLDLKAMQEGLAHLVGEHDFKPFQAAGAKPGPTVRQILMAQAVWEPIGFPGGSESGFGLVRLQVVGTGFLKQMVRGIAGTALQVGEGRRDPACFAEILRSGERSQVGPTAPGRALWLERVWYPGEFQLN